MSNELKVIKSPIELLKEIEAFIMFRLMTDKPVFEVDDMKGIRDSINHLLENQA
jgi:hypothetical protein